MNADILSEQQMPGSLVLTACEKEVDVTRVVTENETVIPKETVVQEKVVTATPLRS